MKKAEQANARNNSKSVLNTVLFFDEANTTEHVDLIKEILCDQTIFGENITDEIRIVAAINPYKR